MNSLGRFNPLKWNNGIGWTALSHPSNNSVFLINGPEVFLFDNQNTEEIPGYERCRKCCRTAVGQSGQVRIEKMRCNFKEMQCPSVKRFRMVTN